MKITYLFHSTYIPGGIERVLCNKANWLINHGYDVTIVTTDQNGRPPFYDFDSRIRIIDLGINRERARSAEFLKNAIGS